MLSRQVAPLLRKFCKVSAYFTIASQRGHALTMLRSLKVILNFRTHAMWPLRTCSQASSTSTISPGSQRRWSRQPPWPRACARATLESGRPHERASDDPLSVHPPLPTMEGRQWRVVRADRAMGVRTRRARSSHAPLHRLGRVCVVGEGMAQPRPFAI
jgi:hypothetical protein